MNAASAPKQNYAFLTYEPPPPPPPKAGPGDEGADAAPRVKHEASWSYSGPLLPPDAAALPASLHEWSRAALAGSLLPRLLPFLAFVNAFVAASGLDHYWLTIRATTPTAAYDEARWHTDDLFFARDGRAHPPAAADDDDDAGTQKKKKTKKKTTKTTTTTRTPLDLETDWKLCTTLVGPPTLFIPARHQATARARQRRARRAAAAAHAHDACTALRCAGCAAGAAAVRSDLAARLARFGAARPAAGQCAFFRIGPDRGAVHSEPPMGGDRVFVNVVPGRRDELAALTRRWGMLDFPRAWWTAPRLGRTYDGDGDGDGDGGGGGGGAEGGGGLRVPEVGRDGTGQRV